MVNNVYLGKLYSWYEPVYSNGRYGYSWDRKLIGLKKRENPVPLYFYPSWYEDKSKMSDYKESLWSIDQIKPPSRKESADKFVELDMTMEDFCKLINEKNISAWYNPNYKEHYFWKPEMLGISASDSEFEFPEAILAIFKESKMTIE